MNSLIYLEIDVITYFEVRNSPHYGGKGSVGYAKMHYKNCKNVDLDALDDNFLERQKRLVAKGAMVPPEDVTAITKEEYEKENEK